MTDEEGFAGSMWLLMERSPPERGAFGRALRDARERQGLSQAEFGNACGKSQAWCARLERGDTPPPDRATCVHVVKALRLDSAWGMAPEVAAERLYNTHAQERLLAMDEELCAWHRARVRGAGEGPTSSFERTLAREEFSTYAPDLSDDLLTLVGLLEAEVCPAAPPPPEARSEWHHGIEALAAVVSGLARLPMGLRQNVLSGMAWQLRDLHSVDDYVAMEQRARRTAVGAASDLVPGGWLAFREQNPDVWAAIKDADPELWRQVEAQAGAEGSAPKADDDA